MKQHQGEMDAILSCLRQKYQQLDGFRNATEEMDKLSDGEDPDTFGIYVEMRDNHIKRIGQIDEQIEDTIARLPVDLVVEVRAALSKDGPRRIMNNEPLALIREADIRNRELFAKIVEMDKVLNEKIGNEEAYATKEAE